VSGPIVHQSTDVGPDACGATATGASDDRCGYGPRLTLLLISPFSKANFVDHQVTGRSSILRFIEDNWNLGRIGGDSFDTLTGSLNDALLPAGSTSPSLMLDPITGEAR
jgi:phospholipase C